MLDASTSTHSSDSARQQWLNVAALSELQYGNKRIGEGARWWTLRRDACSSITEQEGFYPGSLLLCCGMEPKEGVGAIVARGLPTNPHALEGPRGSSASSRPTESELNAFDDMDPAEIRRELQVLRTEADKAKSTVPSLKPQSKYMASMCCDSLRDTFG